MGAVVVEVVSAQAHRRGGGHVPAATTVLAIGVSVWNSSSTSASSSASSAVSDSASVVSSMCCLQLAARIGQRAVAIQQPTLGQPVLIVAPLVVVVVTAAHDHLSRHPTRRGVQHVGLTAGQA